MTTSTERPSVLSGKARAKVEEIAELSYLLSGVDATTAKTDAESVCRGVRALAKIINILAMDTLECPSHNPT